MLHEFGAVIGTSWRSRRGVVLAVFVWLDVTWGLHAGKGTRGQWVGHVGDTVADERSDLRGSKGYS